MSSHELFEIQKNIEIAQNKFNQSQENQVRLDSEVQEKELRLSKKKLETSEIETQVRNKQEEHQQLKR